MVHSLNLFSCWLHGRRFTTWCRREATAEACCGWPGSARYSCLALAVTLALYGCAKLLTGGHRLPGHGYEVFIERRANEAGHQSSALGFLLAWR